MNTTPSIDKMPVYANTTMSRCYRSSETAGGRVTPRQVEVTGSLVVDVLSIDASPMPQMPLTLEQMINFGLIDPSLFLGTPPPENGAFPTRIQLTPDETARLAEAEAEPPGASAWLQQQYDLRRQR